MKSPSSDQEALATGRPNDLTFELLECVLFDGQHYVALSKHLARLSRSAAVLGFDLDPLRVESSLLSARSTLHDPTKVRVILNRHGSYQLEYIPVLAPVTAAKKIVVSPEPTLSTDWALRHKVSYRPLYQRMHKYYSSLGYYDVIFLNERAELTEGSFNNLFLRQGHHWYTPPVSCGLLPGIQRQILLESKQSGAVERILRLQDLHEADEIFLTNAIRGVVKTELEGLDSMGMHRLSG